MWSVSQRREVRIGDGHLSAISVNKTVHSYWPTQVFWHGIIVTSHFWIIAVLKRLTWSWHGITYVYREIHSSLCLFFSFHFFSFDELERLKHLWLWKLICLLSWTECFNEQRHDPVWRILTYVSSSMSCGEHRHCESLETSCHLEPKQRQK